MLTFENMAAFICHYGGTPKVDLMKMYRESIREYDLTGELRHYQRAKALLTMVKMLDEGIEYKERLTTTSYYFEPSEGWNVLYDYLEEKILH